MPRRKKDEVVPEDSPILNELLEKETAKRSNIPFPQAAYYGLAGDMADFYSEYFESPQQFFYASVLTILSSLVCRHVSLDSPLHHEAKLFTLLVAASNDAHKSFSVKQVKRDLKPVLADRVHSITSPASAEGLVEIMKEGHGLPTLLVQDEFMWLMKKAGIQNSVLFQMLAELFHESEYRSARKDHKIEVESASLSMIGCCVTETYEAMANTDFVDCGLLNRILIVSGSVDKRIVDPEFPSATTLQSFVNKIERQVRQIEQNPIRLERTPEAKAFWKSYCEKLPVGDESTRRIEEIGRRLLQVYAFSNGQTTIDKALVYAVTAFLDYEIEVRQQLEPSKSETRLGQLEQIIIKRSRRGRMSRTTLRKLCNWKRYDLSLWERAEANCEKYGYIRVIQTGKGYVIEPVEPE